MKTVFTLICAVFISVNINTQSTISKEDLVPNIGDKWAVSWAAGTGEAFDLNLGAVGPDAVFNFSAYANVNDFDVSGLLVSEINADNAGSTVEIVDGLDLNDIPLVFEGADYFMNLKSTAGGYSWFMPFDIAEDGLNVLGEMAETSGSTPSEWTYYYYGTHFGPGRNIPYDMVLGETYTYERYEFAKLDVHSRAAAINKVINI